MSLLLREGGPRRREGREFSEGGITGEGHRFSVRFSGTKKPDGERPAFWKTGFNEKPAKPKARITGVSG